MVLVKVVWFSHHLVQKGYRPSVSDEVLTTLTGEKLVSDLRKLLVGDATVTDWLWPSQGV